MNGPGKRIVLAVLLGVITPVLVYNPPAVYAANDCNDPQDGCDKDDPPTPAEIAEGNKAAAGAIGTNVNELSDEQDQKGAEGEADAQQTTGTEGATRTNSPAPGDPVLASSGQYEFRTTDIELPGTGYEVKRKYLSEEPVTGSVGHGWLYSVDSRIMRGFTAVDEDVLSRIEALVAEIWTLYDRINKNDPAAAAIAEELYETIYLPAKARLDKLRKFKELAELNLQSKFPGSPEYYEGIGTDHLLVIDEEGTPRVYEPDGPGVWLPQSALERLYERVESVDGGGAESTAGFVWSGRGGRKRYYNGYGMLIAVEELNGNRVEIERDENGKAVKIRGTHGDEWTIEYSGAYISVIRGPEETAVRYGYQGAELGWVRDSEGDLVRYGYAAGRLNRIEKADGSFIGLTYGYEDPDGALLVTATRHEEGASERFDYNPGERLTTYTNHSGVVTRYWYDEQHRPVREHTETEGLPPIGITSWASLSGRR